MTSSCWSISARASSKPSLALERRAQVVRRRQVGVGRGPGDRVALLEHGGRLVEQTAGGVELPGAHRVADRARQRPPGGLVDDRVVVLACLGALGEERRVLGPDDPLAPQVLVGLVGVLLEQVDEAAPVGRAEDAFGLGCVRCAARAARAGGRRFGARRRLVRAGLVRRRLPHLLEPLLPRSLGDLPRDLEGRGIGVVLGRALFAPDGTPGVERDLRLAQLVGQLVALGLDLEVGGRLEGVVRGERLERPAIGQEVAVEPRMGGLVQDHEVVGVVGDLGVTPRGVEQPGVAAGRAADGFLDDQPLLARPRQADPLGELRESALEEAAHPLAPGGVLLPVPDREPDRYVGHGRLDRLAPRRRPAGRQRSRRRTRAACPAGRSCRSCGPRRRPSARAAPRPRRRSCSPSGRRP